MKTDIQWEQTEHLDWKFNFYCYGAGGQCKCVATHKEDGRRRTAYSKTSLKEAYNHVVTMITVRGKTCN